MNAKIIVSLMSVAATAALAGGASMALFSDTETASNNTFAAGTLDLKVGGDDTPASFTIEGLKPLDTGNAKKWEIENDGNLPGKLGLTVGAVTNTEGTPADFEPTSGTVGELGGQLTVAMWVDADKDGAVFEAGDYYLIPTGTTPSFQAYDASHTAPVYYLANDFGGKVWTNLQTISGKITTPVSAGNFTVDYIYPDGTSVNLAQGDSVRFDMVFGLTQ